MSSRATDEQADILIAGGGYVGLTLALALVREIGDGLRIAVIERGREPPPAAPGAGNGDPRASAISASSRQLLSALGLWDALEPDAVPVARIEITDTGLDAGVRRSLLGYDNVTGDGEPASWIVPNGALAAALDGAVRGTPAIVRHFGVGVTGLAIERGAADIALDDGRHVVASLAIAADGRRSALREAAGIKTVGWDYDQTGIVTTIAHELDHGNRAIQHFLPGGPFALLPLKGGRRSCITWSETASEARRIMALDDAAFLDEVDLRAAGRLGAVRLDGPRRSWPLEAHLARTYVGPRVALVGDAAHGVHPIGGQGLNLGFRDVAALVECVADAVTVGLDPADADALVRYERWRRFDSAMSSAAYTGLNRLFSADNALVRSVREVGLGVLDRLPIAKQMLVDEAAGVRGDVPRLMR